MVVRPMRSVSPLPFPPPVVVNHKRQPQASGQMPPPGVARPMSAFIHTRQANDGDREGQRGSGGGSEASRFPEPEQEKQEKPKVLNEKNRMAGGKALVRVGDQNIDEILIRPRPRH